MNWSDNWKPITKGRYLYEDSLIGVKYIIDAEMYEYLKSLTDTERDDFYFHVMDQAAAAIGRSVVRKCAS